MTTVGETDSERTVPPMWQQAPRGTRWWATPSAAVVAVGVVVLVAALAGAAPYVALAVRDPGPWVRFGTPLLRLLADVAAVVCVGSLVYAGWFVVPGRAGTLSARAYAAVRAAGRWALLWAVAAAALVVFTLAARTGGLDSLGQLPSSASSPTDVLVVLAADEEPMAWLITAVLAALVSAAARVALAWTSAVALAGAALLALGPPIATGHASSQAGHDLALDATMLHVPAAVIWMGLLVALLRPTWRGGAPAGLLARRYHRVATGCWVVLAVSGLVDALVLAPPGSWLGTGYGALLGVKVAATLALGAGGILVRRRWVRGREAAPATDAAGWGRLAAAELVVLGGTLGAAVGLAHQVPPAFLRPVTSLETLLGYDLTGPPSLARLALDWRVDVVFTLLAVLLAVGYLVAVRRLRARGATWPLARTGSWLAGCAVLLVATSSGVGRYAAAMFSWHMVAHMLIAMLVPILLALGGPLTLLDRVLPSTGPGSLAGPREWAAALVGSRGGRVLTQPVVATVMFTAAPFLLYLTGVFDAALRYHWAMTVIDLVFLGLGALFAWVTVGIDPLPRPVPSWARVGLLFAAMPAQAVLAAVLVNTDRVIGDGPAGANMYSSLALPWVGDLLAEQRRAGGIALVLGEVCLLIAIVAVLARWSRLGRGAGDGGSSVLDAAIAARGRTERTGEVPEPVPTSRLGSPGGR